MELVSYSALMGEQSAFLTLKIDTEQPVELRDFVGAFTSLGNEFERYVRDAYPGTAADPKMFVREVRYGCIEVCAAPLRLPCRPWRRASNFGSSR